MSCHGEVEFAHGVKVVVTGGAGFIGSQLGHHLHELGCRVTLIDDMSYGRPDNLVIDGKRFGKFVLGDVRDQELMRRELEGATYVVHLAGIAPLPANQIDPQNSISVNVGGLASTLEAARHTGVKRVLFSSTSATYENNTKVWQHYGLIIST